MQDMTNQVSHLFLLYVGCFFSPWLYVIHLYFFTRWI